MRRKLETTRLAVAGLVLIAAQAIAPTTWAQSVAASDGASRSLDDLLNRVREVRTAEQTLFDRRVAEFEAAATSERAAMLQRAQAARDEREQASAGLSSQFSENEIRINELNRELLQKAASLGLAELFGVARQVANDAAGVFQQSLITTQFGADGLARVERLRSFAAERAVPTPEALEQLWYEMHREMTATGQVARYEAEIVQPDGAPTTAEVVRIGPFNATAGGRFLAYLPALGTLGVLPRAMPDEFTRGAAEFASAQGGYHSAVVDSTRGVLLGLYVERPTLMERIELGEAVGYVIIAVGLAGALAFLYQLVVLVMARRAVGRQLKNLDAPVADNPLGRVLLAFRGDKGRIEENSDVAELRISEAVLRELPRLERFQAFLRLAVAAGPLLGLIGTVIGMIITFQSITESGSSDPRLMATGIGQAMIATVLGLGIAIPLLFANALLHTLSRSIVQILDEQSAGILAESIERQRSHA